MKICYPIDIIKKMLIDGRLDELRDWLEYEKPTKEELEVFRLFLDSLPLVEGEEPTTRKVIDAKAFLSTIEPDVDESKEDELIEGELTSLNELAEALIHAEHLHTTSPGYLNFFTRKLCEEDERYNYPAQSQQQKH